jgi:hypothetical protein
MQVMKRGGLKGGESPEAGMFGLGSAEQGDGDAESIPNPRAAIPENIQNMMSSLNMTIGPASGHVVPTVKPGNPMAGLAVKERHAQ